MFARVYLAMHVWRRLRGEAGLPARWGKGREKVTCLFVCGAFQREESNFQNIEPFDLFGVGRATHFIVKTQ